MPGAFLQGSACAGSFDAAVAGGGPFGGSAPGRVYRSGRHVCESGSVLGGEQPGAGGRWFDPAIGNDDRVVRRAWPSAEAVQEENAKVGDPGWTAGVVEPPSTRVEGFTSRASVVTGQPVGLYAHSLEGPVVVKAYRIGWYSGGRGAAWYGRRPP